MWVGGLWGKSWKTQSIKQSGVFPIGSKAKGLPWLVITKNKINLFIKKKFFVKLKLKRKKNIYIFFITYTILKLCVQNRSRG